jgi:DNA-binding response OmpR family regulator
MRLLLVEKNLLLAQALAKALSARRYAVDLISDGEAAWEQIAMVNYDLILLNINLPKLDGIKLCEQLRDRGFLKPIFLLANCNASVDLIAALDAGADDFAIEPFNLSEIFAKIRALLRRGEISFLPILNWGQLRLDPSTFEVTHAGHSLDLTPKEYAILELLMRYGRRVISRSVMIESIWSFQETPTEETVKSHIKTLRHKLASAGASKDAIETVRGIGYRLKKWC